MVRNLIFTLYTYVYLYRNKDRLKKFTFSLLVKLKLILFTEFKPIQAYLKVLVIGKILPMQKLEWRLKKQLLSLRKDDILCLPVLAKSLHHLFYFELSPVRKRYVSLKYLQSRLIWDVYRDLLVKITRGKKGEKQRRI